MSVRFDQTKLAMSKEYKSLCDPDGSLLHFAIDRVHMLSALMRRRNFLGYEETCFLFSCRSPLTASDKFQRHQYETYPSFREDSFKSPNSTRIEAEVLSKSFIKNWVCAR